MGEYQGDRSCSRKCRWWASRRPSAKMLNSFKGELAIMVRLRSPRVLSSTAQSATDSTFLGLVMEYCPGGSLRDARQHRRRDPRRTGAACGCRTWRWACRGPLSQGVEHRDLKALNVLLTHDLRCKVTDFGLSKVRGSEDGHRDDGRRGLAGHAGLHGAGALGRQHVYGKERRLLVRHRAVGNLGPRCAVARAGRCRSATGRRQAPTPASAAGDAGGAPEADGPRLGAQAGRAAVLQGAPPRSACVGTRRGGAAPGGSSWGSGDSAQGTTRSGLGRWFAGGQESQGAPALAEGYGTKATRQGYAGRAEAGARGFRRSRQSAGGGAGLRARPRPPRCPPRAETIQIRER